MDNVQNKTKEKPLVKAFLKDNWFIVLIMIYVLSPFDLIPEGMVPILGSVDDAVATVAGLISLWQKSRDRASHT